MAAPLSAQVEEFLRQLDDMGVDHHIDVPQATRRLKANNNDVGAAMQEYWEHPDSNKYDASQEQWDENQFSGDRDGMSHTNGASFTIQGPDEHPQSSFLAFGGLQTAAQSRPPSRASNNKSPHHMENVTFPSTGNDPSEMDDDLRQAMEISVRDQGGDQSLAPQQNGVTYTGQQFGPANREQYAPGEWDLVPLGSTSTKEILLDPEPAERKRDLDAPAFLRSGAGTSRLGALLTIYHEIPLVKYAFLHQPEFLSDYGYDNDWWKGKPMEDSALVEEGGEENAPANRFYYELHRLMAFLEKTERSYGSVEVLTKLPVMLNFMSVGSLEAQFFEVWRSFCGNVEEVRLGRKTVPEFTSLFSRGVPSEEASYSEGMDFAVLSLQMPERGSSLETLYDLTDRILWSRSPLEIAASPYLSHLGDVVSFQLDGNESSKHVPIPTVWYPDRYLKENRDAALKMRQQQAAITDRIEQLTVCENKLTYHNPPGKSSMKLSEMFKEVLRHDEAQLDKEDLYSDSDSDVDMIAQSSKYDLSADLKKFMANIDHKLQELKEEKEKAQISLRNLSKLYTEPSEDPKLPPLHPYTLRGVSTTNETTYVCRRSEPDLVELDLDGDRSGPKGDQWWRIQYASSAPGPLIVEKTTEAEVLKAVETERTEDLYLVYASAEAMDVRHITPLPQSLENFVRTDNLAFSNEFPRSDESQNEAFSSPKSPAGKRKYTHSEDGESRFSGDGLLPYENSQKSARAAGFPDPSIDDPRDVIEGIDPFEIVHGDDQQGQEMQERSNGNLALSMLVSGRNENNVRARIPDNMDWEPVVDDPHVSEESPAVRRVNFKE